MNQIEPPYPYFTDADGTALDEGYIWIGPVNQNPQTTQLPVFWDQASSLPASQPIRTLNGFPVRSGSPAQFFVGSEYSISVLSKRGALLYYIADSNSVKPGTVSFQDYGATGSGVETTTIQTALTGSKIITQLDLTTFITSGLSSVGNIINWPAGSYSSNAAAPDPLVLSSLSPAPALTFSNASNHAYSRSFGNVTANAIYNAMYPNISSFDVGSNVLNMVAGSTVINCTATAGYFKNDVPVSGAGSNAVALYGAGIVTVNNGAGWGLNTNMMDSEVRAAGTKTGIFLTGAELDLNIMNPGTNVIGVSVGGNSLAQPTVANAYIVNSLGTGIRWQTGFASFDGCANTALAVGAMATTGANIASQAIFMSQRDNAGAAQVGIVSLQPGGASAPTTGFLTIGGTTAVSLSITLGDILMASTKKLIIGGNNVVGARIGGYGSPTNLALLINFPGSAATLAQTGGTLAQLIADLKTHGLIGV